MNSPFNVHFPDPACICAAGLVYDFTPRENSNKTLHSSRFCKTCGARAQSPVKRDFVSIAEWLELLIVSGREVQHG